MTSTQRITELSRSSLFGAANRARRVRVPAPSTTAHVTAASAAGYYHVRVIETLAGEVVRSGAYRIRATAPEYARFMAVWLFHWR